MPRAHWFYESGQFGCVADLVQGPYWSRADAVNAAAERYELEATNKVDLMLGFAVFYSGLEVVSVKLCQCDSPERHSGGRKDSHESVR